MRGWVVRGCAAGGDGELWGGNGMGRNPWSWMTWACGIAEARGVRTRIWKPAALVLSTARGAGGLVLLGMYGVSAE